MTVFSAARYRSSAEPQATGNRLVGCTLEDLPHMASTMAAGDNILISHQGIPTESDQAGSDAYGLLVFWTTVATVDTVWDTIRSEFLQDRLGAAVAISARKHKADWYIQESKRPYGECRVTVFTPHTSIRGEQLQAAAYLASLLSDMHISHIFYVANADVAHMQPTPSVPQAARLTQPVFESPSHHLVYVRPQTSQAGSWSSNTDQRSNVTSNSSWTSNNLRRYSNTSSSSRADSARW